MSAAKTILERAREAGLSAELAERLERDLVPNMESLLAGIPDAPPSDEAEELQLLRGLTEAYRPFLGVIAAELGTFVEAASRSLDDLFAPDLQADRTRQRSLHHLEEAVSSLVRMATLITAVIPREAMADIDAMATDALEDPPPELRTYLRGVLALLVGLDRVHGELKRLAPWAWMARRELLKSEGLIVLALKDFESTPTPRVSRSPGGWKGRVRIAEDFDAPLPSELENAFYGSSLDPEPIG